MKSKTKTKQVKLPKKLFKTAKAQTLFREQRADYMPMWHEIFTIYSFSNWKDLADRVFSQYIRLKYSDREGNCVCVTCGKKMYWKDAQNWHYRSRACLKYRFNERNCHPQCYNCNINLSGNYRNYYKYIVSQYWEQVEDELRNDKATFKITQQDYENNIMYRYEEIIKMKNQKKLEKY